MRRWRRRYRRDMLARLADQLNAVMLAPINWQIMGVTPPAGIPLINGTQNILQFTTPNDGQYHVVIVAATKTVASTETAGIVQLSTSDGAPTQNVFPGGATTGTVARPVANSQQLSGSLVMFLAPNTTVTLAQTAALTGGASTVFAVAIMAQ